MMEVPERWEVLEMEAGREVAVMREEQESFVTNQPWWKKESASQNQFGEQSSDNGIPAERISARVRSTRFF